jgi:hypothetical protein
VEYYAELKKQKHLIHIKSDPKNYKNVYYVDVDIGMQNNCAKAKIYTASSNHISTASPNIQFA